MPRHFHRDPRRGAIVMLLTVMLPFLLLPVVGLAIDATVIHIVQTKLQAAVDGAALGSGRLLGTVANTSEIAGEFFKANFTVGKAGFFGATIPNPSSNPSISVTKGVTKTITISATAIVPTLFMRVLGYNQATVGAHAQVTRRDSRMVFVLDRSGSMTQVQTDGNTAIADVQSGAAGLIKRFSPGVDQIGLIVFDGSGVVAYPSGTTYNPTVVSTGGPDTSFWDGSAAGSSNPPDAVYQTGKVAANGSTGMADALSLAYIELQKAHKRDLAANGVDDKLNLIVLFTDGVPSGIGLYANDPNHGGPWITSSSGCTYWNSGASYPMYFWLWAGSSNGNPPYTAMGGINSQLASYQISGTSPNNNTKYTPLYWVENADSEASPATLPAQTGTNCSTNLKSLSTLSRIPATDKWGNSTASGDGNGYKDSYFINSSGSYQANMVYISGNPALPASPPATGTNSVYYWGLAMWDAADSAAKSIRLDANMATRGESTPMYTQIFAIGYSGTLGTDAGLLKRLANDSSNTDSPNALPSAWSSQPTGRFILAKNPTALNDAFNTIGSLILRLTM